MSEKTPIFEKFTVRDIVFLAIMAAASMVTSAVMPLVIPLLTTVFGIAQLVTGLQVSLFMAIGLMRVRKVGSLFIVAVLGGLFALLMSPPMFWSFLCDGLLLEVFVALVFRGYRSEKIIFLAAMLYEPLTLPFNLLYNKLFGKEAMVAVASRVPWMTAVMTLAVIAVSALGAWLGIKISKELKKSGAMKK